MTANKFTDIDPKLSQESLEAISLFGFTTMTPVQSSTIPLFLQNKVMVMNNDVDNNDDDVVDDDGDDIKVMMMIKVMMKVVMMMLMMTIVKNHDGG
jgi:hypothetical protein